MAKSDTEQAGPVAQQAASPQKAVVSRKPNDEFDEKANEDNGSASVVAAVAKWILPSVAALFAIVGYIAQSAKQELLGLQFSENDSTSLFISAADFIRATLGVPVVIVRSVYGPLSLAGDGAWLMIATAVTVILVLAPRMQRFRRWRRAWLPASALLLLLLAGKFVLLDEPLFQVRNIILVWGEQDTGATISERLGVGDVGSSASAIVEDVICSRISELARADDRLAVNKICASRSEAEYEARLAGRFVAQVWWTMLLFVAAVSTLRRYSSSVPASAIGIVAATYALMLPYAYGKLKGTTWFYVGEVHFVPTRSQDGEIPNRPINALILSRNSAGATLLVTRAVDCGRSVSPGQESGSGESLEGQSVALSFLPSSQISSIELILRQDVIEWAYKSERLCRNSAPRI